MTITLDNVFCLLHLHVTSRPIDNVLLLFERDTVKVLLITWHFDKNRDCIDNKCKCQGEVDMVGRSISKICYVKLLCLGYQGLSLGLDQ